MPGPLLIHFGWMDGWTDEYSLKQFLTFHEVTLNDILWYIQYFNILLYTILWYRKSLAKFQCVESNTLRNIFMKCSSFMFQTLTYKRYYLSFILCYTYFSFLPDYKWILHGKKFWEYNLGANKHFYLLCLVLVFISPQKVFPWKRQFQDSSWNKRQKRR